MTQKTTQTDLFKHAFREQMKDVGTSIPGHVVSFNSDTQLAQLQIGIKRTSTGDVVYNPAIIIECMIQFAGGDKFHVEHQVDPGDEGIIIFSQRCIDGWVNTGGVADNPITRFHDMNDAYFVPGIRSQPKVITGFDNNGIKLRNKAGDNFIWLKNDGTAAITIDTLNINGNIVHAGNNTQTGNLHVTGTITSTVSATAPKLVAINSLTVDTVEMHEHTHLPGSYVVDTEPVTGSSGIPNT